MDAKRHDLPDPTIVGARPPKPGSFRARIPRGIEVLVRKAAVDSGFRELRQEEGEHAEAILADSGYAHTADGLRATRKLSRIDEIIEEVRSRLDAERDPVAHLERKLEQLRERHDMQAPFYGTKGMRADRPNLMMRWLWLDMYEVNRKLTVLKRRRTLLREAESSEREEPPQITRGISPDRP